MDKRMFMGKVILDKSNKPKVIGGFAILDKHGKFYNDEFYSCKIDADADLYRNTLVGAKKVVPVKMTMELDQ